MYTHIPTGLPGQFPLDKMETEIREWVGGARRRTVGGGKEKLKMVGGT